jgi:hypothetical protein
MMIFAMIILAKMKVPVTTDYPIIIVIASVVGKAKIVTQVILSLLKDAIDHLPLIKTSF